VNDADLAIERAVARSADVAEVMIGRGVLAEAGRLFLRHFAGPACLISDSRAWAAAGPQAAAGFRAAGVEVRAHVIPGDPRPKPTVELSRSFAAALRPGETPVAIGSGVMNDVVKHAAHGAGLAYMCVATAASMDGYTSAGAPLSEAGFKKTIPCRAARVLLADLDVIAAAPREMTGWGYGDLAAKIPAGGDWIIADALGIEPIDDVAWPLVQDGLEGWLAAPERIGGGDPEAVADLFRGLTLVGLAMEAHGSSRPASGADHQIAHLWEMEDLHHGGERISHGACVAVAAVAVLRLFEWLLSRDLTAIDPEALAAAGPDPGRVAREIAEGFGRGEVADRALAETHAKLARPAALEARLARLREVWPDLAARLRARLWSPGKMVAHLHAAGAPAAPGEIGVTPVHLRDSILKARFLRSRYTVLDLLDELGMLREAVAATVPGGTSRREAE
jgi:glycerol-1-phosphate dehydrogenase [NAD(P)+]